VKNPPEDIIESSATVGEKYDKIKGAYVRDMPPKKLSIGMLKPSDGLFKPTAFVA